MNAPEDGMPPHFDEMFFQKSGYQTRAKTLKTRIKEFHHALTVTPVQSIDLYEMCILDCIRLGLDKEAYSCAKALADYVKGASRYTKLAFVWTLRNRSDICTLLLAKYLDDFFCDVPFCSALLDYNRIMRFRYTLWDQGQICAFGDNRNRTLGVKADFIPKEKPLELDFPGGFQLTAIGSSTLHTIFQGISGDFYGCGAARNFMVNPKSDNELIDEPTRILIKFEPTDMARNFYISDTGTVIFTDRYVYVIGKKVDPKRTGKKWAGPWPEKWFTNCGKGTTLSKNLMRFTIDEEMFESQDVTITMPFNGAYISKDNHAMVDFRGKPIKVLLNDKFCYYSFEDEPQKKHILNYVITGKEHKMGVGPDSIYPSGLCITMAPGAAIHMGRLRWAKKANCTDENDVKQYTLLAYLDEVRGALFMERFVATPDDRGFIYQIGRPEKRPFYSLRPAMQESHRQTLWIAYTDWMNRREPEDFPKPADVSFASIHTILNHMDHYVNPDWLGKRIAQDMRYIHMIGFIAYALTEKTKLINCHNRCPTPCYHHPLRKDAQPGEIEFRETYSMPQLFDPDRDAADSDDAFYPDVLKDRLRTLMNTYDDNTKRFSPIYESEDTRVICEMAQHFNKQEINFCRERGQKPEFTKMRRSALKRCIQKHVLNIRIAVQWLEDSSCYFTEKQNDANLKLLYTLIDTAMAWLIEKKMSGAIVPLPSSTSRIPPHFQTRNPSVIVAKKIQAGLLDMDTVPMDLSIRFNYSVKTICSKTNKTNHLHTVLSVQTNAVLLHMINPKMNEHIRNNVLHLNQMINSFDTLWTVTLEYPFCVFFFLQHYRQSPVTMNETPPPVEQLRNYGFRLKLEEHAADCPDRMFGVSWHYASLQLDCYGTDEKLIAPAQFGEENLWHLQCRDKLLKVHKYLLLVYSRHPDFMNRDNWLTGKFDIDETYDIVLASLRILSDINYIERYTWGKRVSMCRFLGRYKFVEALDDALAAIVLCMREEDAFYIRVLIEDFPISMCRHIGILRPTVVMQWSDTVFPNPKIVHMARIAEYWPERAHSDLRITKSHMDPTFSRLLRTDEEWKRSFFSDENDTTCDIEQMLNEDMFTKLTFDRKDKPEVDEV